MRRIKAALRRSDAPRMRIAAIGIVLLASSAAPWPAAGEIEKRATACERVLCFHWWPKLPPLEGWHQDEARSFAFGVNALAPDGFTFGDAETVIYAKALPSPSSRRPKATGSASATARRGNSTSSSLAARTRGRATRRRSRPASGSSGATGRSPDRPRGGPGAGEGHGRPAALGRESGCSIAGARAGDRIGGPAASPRSRPPYCGEPLRSPRARLGGDLPQALQRVRGHGGNLSKRRYLETMTARRFAHGS
jgi:hypothetical protein